VVYAKGDIPHMVQGQKVTGQGHQTEKFRDQKSAVSSEREDTGRARRPALTSAMTSQLKALGGCSLPLAGAYFAAVLQAAQLVIQMKKHFVSYF